MQITARIDSSAGPKESAFSIDTLVIAGWAGRDRDKMEEHIRELEALGVARPRTTPTFYRVSAGRLTTADVIQHTGDASSGEAEAVLLAQPGGLYVGLASDHTDRRVEGYGVTVSKQMCDKPVAAGFWPFEEVADHWDSLILRAWAEIDGESVLYQEGPLSGLLPPGALIEGYCGTPDLPAGTAMLCGTLPAIGGVRPASRFVCELRDPVLSRRLTLSYKIEVIPIVEDIP